MKSTVGRPSHYLSDWDKCQQNGWGVGTVLLGDEGHGPAVIEIVYLSRWTTLCVTHAEMGRESEGVVEHGWTLSCRDWVEVPAMRNKESK